MKRHHLSLFATGVGLVLGLLASPSELSAEEKHRYWDWGWGLYGLDPGCPGRALDNARFDWTFICFGNDPADQSAVDRCNEILKLNPKHKFVIRVWSIGGLGDCPENSQQATLFHYWYKPGVREALLKETRRQVELIAKGISKPENVAGATFLEELPGHFSSCCFRDQWANWKKGDPLPWDIQRFQKEIETELGEPFDLHSEKHRLWWGKKYVQALGEIYKVMKEAMGGKPIIYYQMTCFRSMDYQPENRPMRPEADPLVVPIYYKQIIRPGMADGIFGYPNNAKIWESQTQKPAQALKCLVFSQISQPPGMRLCKLDEMVTLARWDYPGNMGGFLFPDRGRKTRAWNELAYQDGSYWSSTDHIRRFGWEYKIGLDVVDRNLGPRIEMDYNLAGLKKEGFVHLQAHVFNPRHSSWYGGSVEKATLKDMKATLKVPEGFSIPPGNNAGPTLPIGDILPQAAMAVDWWVRLDKEDPSLPDKQAFQITAVAAGGARGEIRSAASDQAVPALEPRFVTRSGDQWLEPTYRLPAYPAVVELEALNQEVMFPELSDGFRRAVYRDILRPNTRLVIGPGTKATLYGGPVFPKDILRFAPHQPGPDGAVVFKEGYSVYQTAPVPVCSGESYAVQLIGWGKDGGRAQVLVRFDGQKEGKATHEDVTILAPALKDTRSTEVAKPFRVPVFDQRVARMRLYFYRFQSKGTLFLESFDCRRADIPEKGLDVSARLEGMLDELTPPFSLWTYKDLSNPDEWGRPKLRLRFLSPTEVKPLVE